jgi:hypothetical protein
MPPERGSEIDAISDLFVIPVKAGIHLVLFHGSRHPPG